MNTRLILVTAFALSLASVACQPAAQEAASGAWTQKADMPTARVGAYTGVVDGIMYIIGGGDVFGGPAISTVEAYNPQTDTWTTKAPLPTPRIYHATGTVNGKIYVIGGSSLWALDAPGRTTVEEYDPQTDTWTQKADMPGPRVDHVASVVDGKIYVIGGALTIGIAALSTVEVYDPATDTWTTAAPMPTPRLHLASSTVDGMIYVIGGSNPDWPDPVSTVEAYDPQTDTWTTKASIPVPKTGIWSATLDGKVYVVSGRGKGGSAFGDALLPTVDVYDPQTDTWTTVADIPTARTLHAVEAVGGEIYAIGGIHREVSASLEAYTPGI